MRDTLLIIHILAAGAWIGGSLTVRFLTGRMRTAGHDTGANFMAAYERMGRAYFPPAAIVILLTGILLVLDSDFYAFRNTFVIIGILVVVAGALLGSLIFDPIAQTAKAAHAAGDDAAVGRAYARFNTLGLVDIGILLLAVVAMVAKFGI